LRPVHDVCADGTACCAALKCQFAKLRPEVRATYYLIYIGGGGFRDVYIQVIAWNDLIEPTD